MLHLNPYLHFDGNAEEAMNFYKIVFNSEFTILQRFGDNPGSEKMPAADRDKVMHISLPVGKGDTVIMATDIIEMMRPSFVIGTNFYICIHAESEQEVDRLFAALSADGEIKMPVNKMMWGAYFGICKDKFGIQWMISYEHK